MEEGFDRSLDVDKLKIVADRLLEYGYEPRISIFDTTYHNLRMNRMKNEDFGTKWKILRKLSLSYANLLACLRKQNGSRTGCTLINC